jgi:hypothetical protein
MGRVAYQSMASHFPKATDDPNADPIIAARKVVYSRSLKRSSRPGPWACSGRGRGGEVGFGPVLHFAEGHPNAGCRRIRG